MKKKRFLGGGVGRFAVAVATSASMVLATPGLALACTQVYMGSGLTASGDTIYGREEDYASRHVKVFGVQEATSGRTYISGESDFKRTVDHTYRYTYVRDTEADWGVGFPPYSEAGINEKGVTCSATLTTNVNDKIGGNEDKGITGVDPATDAGLGEYNLTDVVLGEAATARDGVNILGKIMDDVGTAEHNQIWIGDANEVWNFQQLSGHQWIAVKMSSDVASVNPNMGDLQFKVNLDDTNVCLHSADLVKVAKEAGTDAYFEDGTFNVAQSYGNLDPGNAQKTRYAQGRAYLGAALGTDDYTKDDDGAVATLTSSARQLFFTPGRSDYSLYDMQRLLAARGVGTDFDANANTKLYAIGNNRGVESHLFQTRKGLSSDIATVQWEALSRTEFSVYVPSYSALLTEVPEDIYSTYDGIDQSHTGNATNPNNAKQKGEKYDDVNAALADGGDNMDYVMMDLNTLTYNNRDKCGDGVAAYLKALQTAVNTQQTEVDSLMQATAAGDARTELANKAFASVSVEVYAKASELRKELREYLKSDQSKPFAASDLNSDGTLKEPLKYTEKTKAPVITTQPADASYTTGQAASALTVDAKVLTGDTMSYTWEKSTDSGKTWQTVGSGNTYVPATNAEGEAQYKAVVTSTKYDVSTESDVATVTVSKPVEPEPAGSMYRLYNPNSGEHFYTASAGEAGAVVKAGWRYEGVGWKAPETSNTPVYRLYNPNAGDHHYTLSAGEKDYLVSVGWNYEGIGWYSDDAQSVPVYREYNPNAIAGAHNFTTNKDEDTMLAYAGWNQEGIAWYGVKE